MTKTIETAELVGTDRRSVDFLVRSMHDHHMKLSQMADQKAQILLGVCSIIMTVSLNQLMRDNLAYGMTILSLGMFITMIPTILTVRPRLGEKNSEATKKKSPPRLKNPLFFGDFTNLTPDQYLEEMNYLFNDSDKLYESLLLNVYNNGKILAEKKYYLLSMSYNLFLVTMFIGVFVTLIDFAVS